MTSNRTARNYHWEFEPNNEQTKRSSTSNSNNTSLNDPLIEILLGQKSLKNPDIQLNPKLKELLPDPSKIDQLDKALDKVIEFHKLGKRFGILSDYDVDGATSAAQLYHYFAKLDTIIEDVYIPHRVKEGYGPNQTAVDFFIAKKVDLVFFTDCGATANLEVEKLNQHNITVIIIDHHKSGTKLVESYAQVNPNKGGCSSGLTNLSAGSLVFIFLIALNRRLRKEGFFSKETQPDLTKFIELAALSTVADLMHLDNLNRAIVRFGLNQANDFPSFAMQALREKLKINLVQEEDISFKIAPLINAGARIADPYNGYKLLISNSLDQAGEYVDKLKKCNNSRKLLQVSTIDKIRKKISLEENSDKKTLFIDSDESYHAGIIGLIAAEVAERYNSLAVIGNLDEGIVRASLRVDFEFNLSEAIKKAILEKLIISGGGHAKAAGIEYLKTNEDKLYKFFENEILKAKNDQAQAPQSNLTKKSLLINSEISLGALSNNFYRKLQQLGPFGMGNEKPIFILKETAITKLTLINNLHSLVEIQKSNFNPFSALSFFSRNNGIHTFLEKNQGLLFDFVIKLAKDDYKYRAKEFQIQIIDARVAS